jgi:nitroreductase
MIELLRQRRSIRKFLPKKVEAEKIDILKEALLRSPTSRNIRPWEFIIVDEPVLLEKLSRAKQSGSAFLKGAPLAVVVLADAQQSDVWVEDCSIASILLQLTAQSLGLGSCWVQIRKRQNKNDFSSEEYVQMVFNLPEHLKVESIIGLGYAAEHKQGITKNDLDGAKTHINKYLS